MACCGSKPAPRWQPEGSNCETRPRLRSQGSNRHARPASLSVLPSLRAGKFRQCWGLFRRPIEPCFPLLRRANGACHPPRSIHSRHAMSTFYTETHTIRKTANGSRCVGYRYWESFGREAREARSWGCREKRGTGMIWLNPGEDLYDAIARRNALYQ